MGRALGPASFVPAMNYTVIFATEWRYRDRKRGPQVVAAGTYRVPDQMKDAVAKMAIDAGKARRLARPVSRVKPKPPENRSLGPSPENKSLLD